MRAISLATLSLISAVALGACASHARYAANTDTDSLAAVQARCDARGGILVPRARNTGQPNVDNVCDVTNARDPSLRNDH